MVQPTMAAANGAVATQQGAVGDGATISRAEHPMVGAGAVPLTTTSNLAMVIGIRDLMVMEVDLLVEVCLTFIFCCVLVELLAYFL